MKIGKECIIEACSLLLSPLYVVANSSKTYQVTLQNVISFKNMKSILYWIPKSPYTCEFKGEKDTSSKMKSQTIQINTIWRELFSYLGY